ncbi:MAG: protein kinase domain-containing protein [Bryobacteraceae bacterium]
MNQIVSHYRVTEKLGGGGMGVVYRAEDLKLGRHVALKFLPEDLTRDSAAVERFEREARAAAAISHPNICTVYEIGEFNGSPFLALELLEGETLKKRIGGKSVPAGTLLDWAIQITHGLEAAHIRGIVHRDLKPANLFITKAGQAKILDFGLAKLRSKQKTTVGPASDNTMTIMQTDPGGTMGTPAYMSPEQARGEELDLRTDLFSLGVVLYEMATGALPFQGPSAGVVIASLLRDSPRAPVQLNPELPEELGRVIIKALQKDPNKRYQTSAELRDELKHVKRDIDSGQLSTTALSDVSHPMPLLQTQRRVGWLFAMLAGLVAAAIMSFLLVRPMPPPRVLSTTQITSDRRSKSPPFLSDGSRLYFNTGTYLVPRPYQVSIQGGESVPLSIELPNAWLLDMSSDRSQFLVGSFGLNPYAFNAVTLWTAPVLGGSPGRWGDFLVGDAAWSPDNRDLIFTKGREKELDIARTDGSGARKLVTAPGPPSFPRWSPDGKTIRFTVDMLSFNSSRLTTQMHGSSLWEVSKDGSHLHPLFPAWRDAQCCGSWTRDGKYFVFQAESKGVTTVWGMREKSGFFRQDSQKPVQLTTGPMDTYGPSPSFDGKQLFVGGRQSRFELVRYDAKTKQFLPFLSGTSAEGLDFSRDGNRVVYVAYPEGTLWRSTVDGKSRVQLTSPPLHASLPRWSPDGTRIAFAGSYPGQRANLCVLRAEGGQLQQLTTGETRIDPTWSPDGNSLAFGTYPLGELQEPRKVAVQVLDLTTRRVSVLPGSESLWSPRWSPNGRYIAALSTDTRVLSLFDLESKRWTELAKANFGYPSWSRDSKYIYFDTLGNDPTFFRVRIRDRKVEPVVGLKNVLRKVGTYGFWTGLGPDDSPLLARDASFDEIYALDWEAP